jgi:2-polyprenyl-3-methyl-5-hydroxy-6-metoxy-1,4-benzoquinol methylase
MSCCPPRGAEPFGSRTARRDARRYRRHGLDPTARRMVELTDPAGRAVLEVGAGVGALQAEVLRRGATRATGVDLSPAYEREADALLTEQGVRERADRVVADLTADPEAVDPADVVVLHRVVCCTSAPEELLRIAGSLSRRRLVLSFPRPTAWLRAAAGLTNTVAAVIGWGWRFRVHDPSLLVGAVESAGLRLRTLERGRIWQIAVLDR